MSQKMKIGIQFFADRKPVRYWSLAQDEEAKEATIVIYGDITSWPWLKSDVSSYLLSQAIADIDADVINVCINSYGGETAEGLAIYNALRRHKARIRTICDGFACSAASIVFMAGDERVMNTASLLMIHNVWTYAEGNAEELRKAASDLDVISGTAANAYREHVNISDEELERLLSEETWITPTQAVEWGFATAVGGEDAAQVPSQSARKAVFERMTAPVVGIDFGGGISMTAYATPTQQAELYIDGKKVAARLLSGSSAAQNPPVPEEKTVSTFLSALARKEQ